MRRHRTTPAVAAVVVAVGLAAAGCTDRAETSLTRGDRLLARDEVEGALAEYRLARRQLGEEPEVVARLAHAYVLRDEVETALQHYQQLVAEDSTWRYRAAADLTDAAREALEQHGPDRMARVLEPLVPMGIELIPRELRLELAEHHVQRQEFERALPLLLSVTGDAPEPDRELSRMLARAYQEMGGCRQALPHFEQYLQEEDEDAGGRGGARWHFGSCLYDVARADRQADRDEDALSRLERLIELGTPRTLMDRAHFLRGELLAEAGRRQEALEAFREVLRLNPDRTRPLARSAQERVREIRYGEPPASDSLSPTPEPPR